MKCPNCYIINLPTDTVCYGCKTPLTRKIGWGGAEGGPTPAWVYLFVVLCAAIPVASLGGCVPILIGVGGAGMCLTMARSTFLPVVLRVLACLGITVGSWILFSVMAVGFSRSLR